MTIKYCSKINLLIFGTKYCLVILYPKLLSIKFEIEHEATANHLVFELNCDRIGINV
jgi:hypothetical protein